MAMCARTDRLLPRPGWAEDSDALVAAIGDEAVVRNLSRVPWPYGPAEAEAFLGLPQDERRPRLLIFTRASAPQLVGGIGLMDLDDGPAERAELGYWIARGHWRQGYATEAARAVLDLAFHGLRLSRIEAGHFADNTGSQRVLAKLGFAAQGSRMLHRSGLRPGVQPCCWYGLDAADWIGAEQRLVA
jgi:RimJ/RimL family protein N-acetyltransferase